MRKITVLSIISLDGLMQAPGGPEEDQSCDFKYGGWVAPYVDEVGGKVVQKELNQPADYLLGRKTLFGDGPIPAAFTLTESLVTSTGVIIACYKPTGEVETGTVEA